MEANYKNTFNTVNYKEQFLIKLASTKNVTFNVSCIKSFFFITLTTLILTTGILKPGTISNDFFCSTLSEFENFLLCERILINVTTCQNETSS
jgi:hypothetical protein